MTLLGRGIRKTIFGLAAGTCLTMGTDAAVSLVQFPFVSKECPSPKIAMMTNMMGIFTNVADPQIFDEDYRTAEQNEAFHERLATEMPAEVSGCYKIMPTSGLVWAAQKFGGQK